MTATDLDIEEEPPPRRIVIGAGRIGTAFSAAAGCALITRERGWFVLDEPAGDPIAVCVRNDDLGAVLAAVPKHRWPDLVFVQNGMIDPWLEDHGLEGNTRGLLFFAVATRGGADDDCSGAVAGGSATGEASRSMPKSAPRSPSRTFSAASGVRPLRSVTLGSGASPRSTSSSSGSSSRRTPRPYSAAQTCLQNGAASRHWQNGTMWRGAGSRAWAAPRITSCSAAPRSVTAAPRRARSSSNGGPPGRATAILT